MPAGAAAVDENNDAGRTLAHAQLGAQDAAGGRNSDLVFHGSKLRAPWSRLLISRKRVIPASSEAMRDCARPAMRECATLDRRERVAPRDRGH